MTNESKVLEVLKISEDGAMTLKEISQKCDVSYKNISPVLSKFYSKGTINRVGKGGKYNPYKYWKGESSEKENMRKNMLQAEQTEEEEVIPYNIKDGKLFEIAVTNGNNEPIAIFPVKSGTKLSPNISDYNFLHVNWKQYNGGIAERAKQEDKDDRISFKQEQMKNVLLVLSKSERNVEILKLFYRNSYQRTKEIQAKVGFAYSQVSIVVKLLEIGGLIKRIERRGYTITPFGADIYVQLFGVDINLDSGLRGTLSR